MHFRKIAVAAGAAGALAASLLSAAPASADYAPSASDVVGVGSDTVQYVTDFLADGEYALSSTGSSYNAGHRNKLISFDATADANARAAYGSYGLGNPSVTTPTTTASGNSCTPGTGGTVGTGNQNATHTGDKPCGLNPTVVLRAGLRPVLRPNGSGAGFNALKQDVANATHNIDFARRSSAAADTSGTYDSVNVGRDTLAMLSKTGGNASALTAAQLKSIYECTQTTWTTATGGTNTSTATIVPLIPQVGSGTRSSFIAAIGTQEANIGTCVVPVEENDPEAIDAATDPNNAIEPMSSGRLYMYKGQDSTGTSLSTGYFTDPSCAYGVTAPAVCTLAASVTLTGYTGTSGASTVSKLTGTSDDTGKLKVGDAVSGTGIATGATITAVAKSGTTPNITTTITLSAANTAAVSGSLVFTSANGKTLNPNVTYWTASPAWSSVRNLWVYFRDADVNSTTAFQPGTTQNWVRALFYNPCSGTNTAGQTISNATGTPAAAKCTNGGTTGPGGNPFLLDNPTFVESAGVSTTSGLSGNDVFGAFVSGGA